MWGAGDEPPPIHNIVNDANNPSDLAVENSETCENEDQLTSYKELMLKNQFELKKKEEELQEYAEKLTRIKSKVKSSHRSADSNKSDPDRSNTDTSSDAKTPNARTHLLQKKLEENRRIFEQRNRELNESQRDVEEKVQAIKQQMDESDVLEKEKKYIELNGKILELQATIIDLQDNLKGKDAVIDAKTRAITLMSENLSRKGKNIFDTLDGAKYEAQEDIADELSLENKIMHLLKQLESKEEEIEQLCKKNGELEKMYESISEKLNDDLNEKKIESTLDSSVYINEELQRVVKEKEELKVQLDESTKIIEELRNDMTKNVNDSDEIVKLKKELEETNKTMIKLKAQHKSKLKNVQKRLQNTQMVSNVNEELVALGNQVAMLEEEKGNLQLSLVDFDELKATNEELQRQLNECQMRVAKEQKENQMQMAAIAQLENQKLDLIQELHSVKQEMASLEDENAESENERVTAELKIIQLEEQLENLHKAHESMAGDQTDKSRSTATDDNEWEVRIESLQRQLLEFEQEKVELLKRLEELDKKSSTSDSTESFERIMETGDGGATTDNKTILNEKIINLRDENHDLVIKITKIEEKHQLEIENLREEIENLNTANTELHEKLHDYIEPQVLASLESEIHNLKQLNEEIRENSKINEEKLRQQIEELEQKVAEDNSTIANYKKTIESLEEITIDNNKTIESLEKIINEKLRVIENLESEKFENSKEIYELRMKIANEIDERQVCLESLERREVDAEHSVENLKKNEEIIKNLQHEINELRESLDQNRNILVENSQIQQQLISEKLNLTEELESIKSEKLTLSETIETIETENRRLHEDVNNKNHNIDELKQIIASATNKPLENLDTMKTLMIGLIDELREKDEKAQVQSAEILRIRDDLDARENQIKQFEAAVEVEATLLKQKVEQQTVASSEREANIATIVNEMESSIEEKTKEIAELQAVNQNLNENMKELQFKIQTLEETMVTLSKEKEELQWLLQEETQKHEHTRSMLAESEKLINETQSAIIAEKDAMAMILRDKENLQHEISQESNRYKEAQSTIAELTAQLDSLQVNMSVIMKEKQDLESEYQTMMNDHESHRLAIEEQEVKIEELQSKYDAKEHDMAVLLGEKENVELSLQEEILKNSEKQAMIEELNSKMMTTLEHYENLKQELNNAYRQMDQLQLKHTEDIGALNERLENVLADLASKSQECENLRALIAEKDAIIGQSVTKEVRAAMEQRIASLECELETANNNTQAQLQKMKIIAANLKKKTQDYRHVEDNLREIEEKWATERQEKEELAGKLETAASKILAKDELITQLEDQIQAINNDTERTVTSLNSNLASLELNLKNYAGEYESLKLARDEIATEYQKLTETSALEINAKNLELAEMTERARELGVRMQVMETEYVEQLNLIQQLKTENGMLLSKQSQLNERLENTEIEFTEYKNNLESFQNKIQDTVRDNSQTINDLMKIRLELAEELKRTQEKVIEIEEDVGKLVETFKNPPSTSEIPEVAEIIPMEEKSEIAEPSDDLKLTSKREIIQLESVSSAVLTSDEAKPANISPCSVDATETTIKLDDDEEIWDWNAQEAEMAPGYGLAPFCSTQTTQMEAKMAELEDIIKDMEAEKLRLTEELTNVQTKNGKLMKKLRVFKIQIDDLQRQLKLQMSSGGLGDLDSAIEEELRNKITELEKKLVELKSDNDKIVAERDHYLKRIDVLIAANEEFTNMKERQDHNLEVMSIRNDELIKKIEVLTSEQDNIQKSDKTTSESTTTVVECTQCIDKIELQENLELLSVENEELRQIIESKQAEMTQKQKEIDAYKIQIEENSQFEKECHKDLDASKQSTVLLEENYKQLLDDAHLKISNLQRDIDQKALEIQTLENNLAECRVNLDEKTEESVKISQEFVLLQSEYKTKLAEIQNLNENLLDKNRNLNENNALLAQLREEFAQIQSDLEHKLVDQQSQIQVLQENLDNNLEQLKCKTEELISTQQEFQHVKAHLEQQLAAKQLEMESQMNLQIQQQQSIIEREQNLCVDQSTQQSLELHDVLLEKDNHLKITEEKLANALRDQEKWRQSCIEAETKLAEIIENMENVTELLNVRVQEVADLKLYIQRLEFDRRVLENCQTTINDLNNQLSNKNSELTSLTSKYESILLEKSQEITALQEKLAELNSQLEGNLKEHDNQLEVIKSLNEALNNTEIVITTTKNELTLKDEKINRVETELGDCRSEVQRLGEEIKRLETMLSLSQDNSNEKMAEIDRQNQELQRIKSEINSEHENTTAELQRQVTAKDEEIADLKYILNESTYPAIIQELQDKIDQLYSEKSQLESLLPNVKTLAAHKSDGNESASSGVVNSGELDVALYMLHQRDVRCEELTHELMQLLEERDTLQLRLSNAIRLNEELGKLAPASSAASQQQEGGQSPDRETKKSVESHEDDEALARKLSQLHNVGHRRDVRLIDERELRNTQQMSFIAHKDALSTLPPDAAARLINAKYTLSRDVQSQSSVLMNWLWRKSTPKIVHM